MNVERLCEVARHAGVQTALHIGRRGVRSHRDNGYLGGVRAAESTNGARRVEAVHDRHLEVHQDGVERAGRGREKALDADSAVFRALGPDMVHAEQFGGNLVAQLVVLREQDVVSMVSDSF